MAPEIHTDAASVESSRLAGDTDCPPEDNPPTTILDAFDWDIPNSNGNSIIVDLGDAAGVQSILLAHKYGNLRFVIQDNATAIAIARQNWAAQAWNAVSDGRVQFQTAAFGDEQPVTNAAFFILHYTIDNLSSDLVIQGLKSLRQAAVTSQTRLLVFFNRPAVPSSSAAQSAVPAVESSGGTPITTREVTSDYANRTLSCDEVTRMATTSGWKPDSMGRGLGVGYIRFLAA